RTEAAVYLQRIAELFRDYKQRALDALELKSGETLLDVGCGAGDDLLAVAARSGGTVALLGVDPDPASLEAARRRAREAGADIRFLEGGLSGLPLESD